MKRPVISLIGLLGTGCVNMLVPDAEPDNLSVDRHCTVPGTARCKERRLETCESNNSWTTIMECQFVCGTPISTTGTPGTPTCLGACAPGARQCMGPAIYQCGDSGLWQLQEQCPGACVGDKCTGVCSPGSKTCADANSLKVCGDDGTWATTPCNRQACVGDQCVGECSPGAFTCGAGPQTRLQCTDQGSWVPAALCPILCVGEGLCGGVCKPNDRRCVDSRTIETCDGNGTSWLPVQISCVEQACVDGQCIGECLPGAFRCGVGPQTRFQCNDQGVWVQAESCESACIGQGQCGGVCTPNTRRCADNRTVELCNAGGANWVPDTTCASVCRAGQCRGECVPESRRCQGASLHRCDMDGAWQPEQTCQFACLETGRCGGVCVPDTVECADSATLRTCNRSGAWVTTSCGQGACVGGVCTGQCAPGSLRCGAGPQTRLVCSSQGTWEAGTPCAFLCIGEGQCGGVCRPQDRRCTGDHRTQETCDGNGEWKPTVCPAACVGDACAGQCVPGQDRCAPSGTQVQTCDNQGQWSIAKATCPFVCRNGQCAGECVPNTATCIDATTISECNANGMFVRRDCGTQACVGTQCTGVCRPDSLSCMNGDVYKCQNNGVWAQHANCSFPNEVCHPTATPACGDNPVAVFGNDTDTNAGAMISANTLYLTRVALGPRPVDVVAFGLRGPAAGTFVNAKVVVYSDSNGAPFKPLMAAVGLPVEPGRRTLAHPTCGILQANTTVWIGVLLPQSVTWGFVTSPSQRLYRLALNSAASYPDPINTSVLSGSDGVGLPVFIEVRERHDCT